MEHALLENLVVAQLVKKLSVMYGTRSFVTMLTRALHWFMS
jgi:hypothetical protein